MPDRNDLPAESAEVASTEEVRARLLALYHQHSDELRRFVLGVLKDQERTSDAMQATLAKALEVGHSARPETFKGWLFRVAHHEALACRRREKAGDKARRRLAALLPTRPDPNSSPESSLIAGETVEAVRSALAGLPDAQRKVVEARIYEDRTFAEIARDSGLPLGTVLTRMRLAMARLRLALLPNDPEDRP
ncbi:MAG: RNA polymerase sigma factor [Isosphaeraceae bacterium]